MIAVGQLVGGRYRIEAPLARGGMGAVYRAVDERLAKGVAVKVMHEGLAGDSVEVARFTREAKAVTSLHHPGLVQILDAGDERGVPYLVMELVVGRTLASILGSEGKLAPLRAADLVEQALFAVSVAHGAGIVHRDLKPGNLMVVDAGGREVVKVLDFGIAQLKTGAAYTRLTQTGVLVGTPMFMAPEQVRGEPCDARTDVYAMGVVLWCCLTGRKPFDAKDVAEIVLKVLGEMPMRADRIEPAVPATLAKAAEFAMQKRREDRFASASAFAAALADLRAASHPGSPSNARPPIAAAASVSATSASLAPDTRPRASPLSSTAIPPRVLVAALVGLFVLVVLLGCVVTALACHVLGSPTAPSLGAPSGTGGPSTGGLVGSGDACDRAARCCALILESAGAGPGDCDQLRTMSQYPQAAASCQHTFETYADLAESRGLHCE